LHASATKKRIQSQSWTQTAFFFIENPIGSPWFGDTRAAKKYCTVGGFWWGCGVMMKTLKSGHPLLSKSFFSEPSPVDILIATPNVLHATPIFHHQQARLLFSQRFFSCGFCVFFIHTIQELFKNQNFKIQIGLDEDKENREARCHNSSVS
jgi:hypothetical protein